MKVVIIAVLLVFVATVVRGAAQENAYGMVPTQQCMAASVAVQQHVTSAADCANTIVQQGTQNKRNNVLRDIISTLPPDVLNAEYAHVWFCNGQNPDGSPSYLIQYAIRNESTYTFENTCPDGAFLVTASVPLKPRFNITGYVTFPKIQQTGVVYAGLPNATVWANSSFAITDENGFYTLSVLPGNYSVSVYPTSAELFTANFTIEVTNTSLQQDVVLSRGGLVDMEIILEYDPNLVDALLGYLVGDDNNCEIGLGVESDCCGGHLNTTNGTNTITFTDQNCTSTASPSLCVVVANGNTIVNATLSTQLDGPIFSFSKNVSGVVGFEYWRLFLLQDSQLFITNDIVGLLDLYNLTSLQSITW